MRRREFIAALGGAAAMPLAARAQPASPVIGFLNTGSPELLPHHLSVFRQALGETGFVEGRNAVVEYRWARGHYDRLPALAAELVRGNVLFWEKYMTEMDESPAAGRRRVPWRGTNPDTQQRGDGELGRAPGPAIVGRNDDSGMTCSSR